MLPHKIKQTAPKEGKPNSKRHIDTTKSHGMIGYMPATGLTNPSLHLRTWLAFFPLASEGWFLFENEAHCDFHVCLGRAETENQSECRHNSGEPICPCKNYQSRTMPCIDDQRIPCQPFVGVSASRGQLSRVSALSRGNDFALRNGLEALSMKLEALRISKKPGRTSASS